jgi:hypothetical protein
MKNMNIEILRFNASELCSRKLWQLVNTDNDAKISETQLEEAVAELANRRHYLAELEQMGRLEGTQREV